MRGMARAADDYAEQVEREIEAANSGIAMRSAVTCFYDFVIEAEMQRTAHQEQIMAIEERQATALESIAASLATLSSCVSDEDTSHKYLRTQPHR